MQCKETLESRKKFIKSLLLKLLENKLEEVDVKLIMAYCEDNWDMSQEDVHRLMDRIQGNIKGQARRPAAARRHLCVIAH